MDEPLQLHDDFVRGQVFGEWDAPITDHDERIDAPLGAVCLWCQEGVRESDNGRISPMGHVEHRECSLRNVMGGIGHHVDHGRYCSIEHDPDAGLGRRRSSLLVWEFLQDTGFFFRRSPTPRDLERWRERLERECN